MPSANTIVRPTVILPTQSLGNATAETQFQGKIPAPNVPGGNLDLRLPRTGELSNRHLQVEVTGRVLPGTTGTFDLKLYIASISSANLLFDTGAISLSVNTSFLLIMDLVWDQSSNTFNGTGYGQMGNVALGIAGLNNVPSSVTVADSVNSNITQYETMLLTGQFGTSNANNGAFIDQFEVLSL